MALAKTFSALLFLSLACDFACGAPETTMRPAAEIAAEMGTGWNLGNSMEVPGGEELWGNPPVAREMFEAVKAAGFGSVRIPCAWRSFADGEGNIDPARMARVKEVVDDALSCGLYVVLNIHTDGGWLEKNCTPRARAGVEKMQAKLWGQISETFREYGDRLLFASANEPSAKDAEAAGVLRGYHQVFVDTVRASGGNNAERCLVVQGPETDAEKTLLFDFLPRDPCKNRLMAEFHYYGPYWFGLCPQDGEEPWAKVRYFWGRGFEHPDIGGISRFDSGCDEEFVDGIFARLKEKFCDRGIPLILGEYGATRRSLADAALQKKHDASRAYYYYYITRAAKLSGAVPFSWDNGVLESEGETFALFDRRAGMKVCDEPCVRAIRDAARDASLMLLGAGPSNEGKYRWH